MKPLAVALTAALFLVVLAAAAVAPKGSVLPAKRYGRTAPSAPVSLRFTLPHSLDELYVSTDVPRAIPDGPDTVGVTSTITVPAGETVNDVNVQLWITHTWIRDLRISLISPDSVEVVLLDLFPGDSVENMTGTWFNDESTLSILDGQAPFPGSYRPQAPLSAFDGHAAGGIWTLRVIDHFALDTGTLDAWTLEINRPVNITGTVRDSRTGQPLADVRVEVLDSMAQAFTDDLGGYGIEGLPADTYSVRFSRAYYDTLLVPDVIVVAGLATTLDTTLVTPYRDYTSSAAPDSIPDEAEAAMTLNVRDAVRISDLDVTVNIEHTYAGDLSLILENPVGDSVILVPIPDPCPPSSGADILNCRFDDNAALPFDSGEAPYTGSWRPAGLLAAFTADSARDSTAGTWTLRVRDNCFGDIGRIMSFTLHFLISDTTGIDEPAPLRPQAFTFDGAYPNPFNSRTEFRFALSRPERVRLTLYNTLGQQAAVVADGLFPAGSHTLAFDAGNLASGLYFARLSAAGGAAQSRKLVLLR